MVTEHLGLTLTLILIIIASNFLGCVLCLFAAPWLIRIARIPFSILLPLVWVLILTGAYVRDESLWNFVVLILFGILGFLMKRYDYSRPAMALGFVLGTLAELYLIHAVYLHGPLFFLKPASLFIIAIIIVLPLVPYLRKAAASLGGLFREKS